MAGRRRDDPAAAARQREENQRQRQARARKAGNFRPRRLYNTIILTVIVMIATFGIVQLRPLLIPCQKPVDISVVADPAVAEPARVLAEQVDSDDVECADISVTSMESSDAQRKLAEGSLNADLWILDSSVRLVETAVGADVPRVMSGSIASSPVVAVTGQRSNQQFSDWLNVLRASNLRLGNPLLDAASAEAVSAAISSSSASQVNAALEPLARGAQRDELNTSAAQRLQSESLRGGSIVTVAAEYQVKQAANVRTVVPRSGTPSLDFPIVLTSQGEKKPAATAVGGALAVEFSSPEGTSAVTRAGLRGPRGTQVGADGSVAQGLRPASDEALVAALERFSLLTLPSRGLVLDDTSRSMNTRVNLPDGRTVTRSQLAAQAIVNGTSLFTDTSQLGLWAFAANLQGAGRDFRPLVPVRALGDEFQGNSQRKVIAGVLQQVQPEKDAGTALYDSILGAWRTMQRSYDPGLVNSVIVVTDGREDDSDDSLTLDDLTATLREEQDPARPVRIIFISITPDTDFNAIEQIVATTGGLSYTAPTPADVPTSFEKIFGTPRS